jgi:hypothetical protein
VAVPVSARQPAQSGARDLGNLVSPLLVAVPTTGDLAGRLRTVAARVRAGRDAATGPAPIAAFGWLFRPVARLGGYRVYLRRQRRLHTLVSHVRGPAARVRLAGATVTAAVPVAVAEARNVTVWFEVLSYAGDLTVSIVADPDRFPEFDLLTERVGFWLGEVSGAGGPD